MKKLKIIQWYTGDIACHQIRVIHACPSLDLVGAFVHHPEKAGKDVGEIAGIGPIGVLASNDIDAMLAMDADCVLYNPPMERYDEIIRILASGKNVISIIAGWNPKKHECYPDIVKACEQGQSSLYGTGLNPGMSYELAFLASSQCTDVESIEIKTCEPQDSLGEVFLTAFGFGKTREELAGASDATYAMFRVLLDVTDLLCEGLQLPHDGHSFTTEFEPSTKDYEGKITMRRGTMAGILIKASTTYQDKPIATFEMRFMFNADHVSEKFLEGRPKHGWIEISVTGTPGSRVWHETYNMETHSVGTWSTGTRAINAIPFVCAAKPGLLSPLDLPLARMIKLHE